MYSSCRKAVWKTGRAGAGYKVKGANFLRGGQMRGHERTLNHAGDAIRAAALAVKLAKDG